MSGGLKLPARTIWQYRIPFRGQSEFLSRGRETTEPSRTTGVYVAAHGIGGRSTVHQSSSRHEWRIKVPRRPRPADGWSRASHRRPGLPSRPVKRLSAADARRRFIFCPRIGAEVAARQMVGFPHQPGRGALASRSPTSNRPPLDWLSLLVGLGRTQPSSASSRNRPGSRSPRWANWMTFSATIHVIGSDR